MRRLCGFLLALLLLASSLPLARHVHAQENAPVTAAQPRSLPDGWQGRTLATRGDAASQSFLLLDERSQAHILYTQETASTALRHTWYDGLAWRDELVIQFPVGQFQGAGKVRFALASGLIAAAWQDQSSGEVKVAVRGQAGWTSQTVTSAGQNNDFSLSIWNGAPALAFYNLAGENLIFTWLENGQWQTEIADGLGRVGQFNSIAVSADGVVHLAYMDWSNLDLRYARRGNDGWNAATLHTFGNAGAGTAIAVDSGGRAHIAYVVHGTGGLITLNYAWEGENGWLGGGPVAATRIGSNLVIDLTSDNGARILFSRYGQGAGVFLLGVDEGNVTETPLGHELPGSMQIDSRNRPHISYYDKQFRDLKYGLLGDEWETAEVRSLINDSAYFGAATDGNGSPLFSVARVGLEQMGWDGSGWLSQPISATATGKIHSSLAYDAEGIAHVAFYRAESGDLLHGQRINDVWEFTTVDSDGDVGRYPRLLLRHGLSPVIVYWDETNSRLKVAERVNRSWQIAPQQNGPPLNSDSSRFDAAGFAPDGTLFITYYDAPNTDLRLAQVKRRGSGWTWSDSLIGTNEGNTGIASAATMGGSGLYLAIAFSHVGTQGGGGLRYGTLFTDATAQWTIGQLASNDLAGKRIVGVDVALKSGSHQMPRIAFVTENVNIAHEVWLASKDGSGANWRFEQMDGDVATFAGRATPPAVFADGVDRVAWQDMHYLYLRSRTTDEDRPSPAASGYTDPNSGGIGLICACLILVCWNELPGRSLAGRSLDAPPLEAQLHAQFATTVEGQRYVELYQKHGREMYDLIVSDPVLLWDAWRALENYTPALIALAAGKGEGIRLSNEMINSSLDIWQRLAALGSSALAAEINSEMTATNNLSTFTGKTVAESAAMIGVDPQALARILLYLPLTQRE